jgi:ATP-binding cassette subfamily F protein 3
VFEVGDGKVEVYPGNYEDYRWRKEGGAEKLQETVSRSATIVQPVNGNQSDAAASDDAKSKRLNPIKRKQMEDRVKEVEAKVSRAETAIAECEAGLQTFVSAEETTRLSQQLASHRDELQNHMAEWEELALTLES